MQNLHRLVSRFSSTALTTSTNATRAKPAFGNERGVLHVINTRVFSSKSGGGGGGVGVGGNDGKDQWESSVGGSFGGPGSDDLGWDSVSSWSTGLTKEHFDGEALDRVSGSSTGDGASQSALVAELQVIDDKLKELESENKKAKSFVDGWEDRMRETSVLLKQVMEPGVRGSYLKDSEKAEMYRLHKENPEVYTVERLAKDYRIMRQRVHAILWLKEEEEEERKRGKILDDSVELLLDTCPE